MYICIIGGWELAEDNEELIAKLQMEYQSGSSVEIAKDKAVWNIGLLYFTTDNLWFINSDKERTQISFPEIIDIDEVKPRKSQKKTKFTKVLKAKYIMNIDFRAQIEDKPVIRTVQVSAAKEILKALRTQLEVRLEKRSTPKKGAHKLDKNELLRRLSVLMELKIEEEDKLKYFLGVHNVMLLKRIN
jgi:hypothetical protein